MRPYLPSITGRAGPGALKFCGGAQWNGWMGQQPVPNPGAVWTRSGHPFAGTTSYQPPVSAQNQTLTCTVSASYPALNVTVSATTATLTVAPPPPLAPATAARDVAGQLALVPIYGPAFAHRTPVTNQLLGGSGVSCPQAELNGSSF